MTIEYGLSEHGHEFPVYGGALLSWNLSSTATLVDEREGYPRTRLLVRAMRERRPAQLRAEVRRLRIDSMGRMFGRSAARLLAVVEAELAELEAADEEGLDDEGLDADATMLPFCACGRRPAECDGSRKGCRKPYEPILADDDGWGDYCSPVEGDV